MTYFSRTAQYEIGLTDRDPSRGCPTFDPQEVEVSSDGSAVAKDTEGGSHLFNFSVTRAIRQEDLS